MQQNSSCMTKYCDACHSANKDHARYCCVCKGKFSGVRFGAHTSANAFLESRAATQHPARAQRLPRVAARQRSRSAPRRTALLAVFLVLLLAPFTYWESKRPSDLWSPVKSSIDGAWQRSVASIGQAMKPAPTTLSAERSRLSHQIPPDTAADGPAPPEAPLATIAAPSSGAAVPAGPACTEVHAALGLCPKKP